MNSRACLSIILAAGEGTRMHSTRPKVLHTIAGLPMIAHVIKTVQAAGVDHVALVLGRGSEQVRAATQPIAPDAMIFEQAERLGTAHAVLAARAAIERGFDDIVVLFGDAPLIEARTLVQLRGALANGAAVAVTGFRTPNPGGYGRLIQSDGNLTAIREDKDCTPEERRITFCNGGLMAIAGERALDLLDRVDNRNAKGEFYLTDLVAIAREQGLDAVAVEASYENALGINNRAELAEAEAVWQGHRRREAMLSGVTLVAPDTVFFSHDTVIGSDSLIEPNVVFGPGVVIGAHATIRAFCHIEGARIDSHAEVGPFARLRPGAQLREKAKVGNFCEVKQALIDEGAKVNHLSYIGDAEIGAKANIGAGTITCNYDGANKHRTEIGSAAFVGSNTSLVAPVTIGPGAYIASGSVITENVPADALAFGRARQTTLPDRAKEIRRRNMAFTRK